MTAPALRVPPLDDAALRELADKYQQLVDLRARRDQDVHAIPDRARLRELARRFPGCLRELDCHPLQELQARAAAVQAALQTGRSPALLHWIWAFHRVLQVALWIKRQANAPAGVDLQSVASVASQRAGTPLDGAFVQAILRPPQGRLAPVVIDHVAAGFGISPAELSQTLFPSRRRPAPG